MRAKLTARLATAFRRSVPGLLSLWATLPNRALVFYATGDPDFNTTAPTGELADCGWQWQGNWRGFGGTVIASNLFLTAKHVGGAVGDMFSFAGRLYPTLAAYPDPETDLMVWKVCGTFPTVAPLYAGRAETGTTAAVFGSGLGRGAEVWLETGAHPGIRGWHWGANDGRLRWGENVIVSIERGGSGVGNVLTATFDAQAGPNEAMLTGGDSGSGLFVRAGGVWQLAGVNLAADGPFRLLESDENFSAALFDRRGLRELGGDSTWHVVPDGPTPAPASLYATRVSTRIEWVRSIIDAEARPEATPTAENADTAAGPYAVVAPLAVEPATQTIVLPAGTGSGFFRLQHCRAVRILDAALTDRGLELRWE